jgi:hypothetical protein
VGKPGVQKTLLICLINIHHFRNSDCFLVDRSSKNLTTLLKFTILAILFKPFGCIALKPCGFRIFWIWDSTWWRLFQKLVMCTKFDIYVLINIASPSQESERSCIYVRGGIDFAPFYDIFPLDFRNVLTVCISLFFALLIFKNG